MNREFYFTLCVEMIDRRTIVRAFEWDKMSDERDFSYIKWEETEYEVWHGTTCALSFNNISDAVEYVLDDFSSWSDRPDCGRVHIEVRDAHGNEAAEILTATQKWHDEHKHNADNKAQTQCYNQPTNGNGDS